MRWFLPSVLALVSSTLTLTSCDRGPDPDREIEGGGKIAKGFEVRFDKPESKKENIRLVEIDGGYEAENGPNAIFWRPADQAKGSYSLSARVHHLDSFGHPHGAGLIFGGNDLTKDSQTYTYFLVRGDGKYLIKTRDADLTKYIATWTEHDSIRSEDDKGVAKNHIKVEVGKSETRFLVNGTEVFKTENSKIHTDGLFGLRIVHNLKIHFLDLRHEPSS